MDQDWIVGRGNLAHHSLSLRGLSRVGTLLWVYCQYIEMPYIALAQQAWTYDDVLATLSKLDPAQMCGNSSNKDIR